MSLLPYNAVQLPKEEEERALAAIGESEHSRKVCLKTLRSMLKDKKFKPCLDDDFLLAYLRANKFDCERTACNMQTYYELIRDSPEYFETCILDALTKSNLNPFQMSPFRMKDNSGLIIQRYFKTDVAELPLPEKVYLDAVAGFYIMQNPINQICGLTVISDAADFTISKIPQYTNYSWITIGASVMLNSPGQIKKVHVVNVSEAVITAYNALTPFIPKKMVDMLQFHSDNTEFKDLHEFISPEILPERYGGHLKESELINCMGNILRQEDHFRKYFPL